MLKSKLLQQQQGFTLTEVLVAILITSVFVATAMQAMVIAAIMKVQAQKIAQATTWVQQDFENVKYKASLAQLPYSQASCKEGYGTVLDVSLVAPDPQNQTIGAKNYRIERVTDPGTESLKQLLKITYHVVPSSNDSGTDTDAIASISTEVFPDAAAQCP